MLISKQIRILINEYILQIEHLEMFIEKSFRNKRCLKTLNKQLITSSNY